MSNFNQYWALPGNERQIISEQYPEQETGEPVIPTRYTLEDTFEAQVELAVCASSLFIMIVQDCGDLGGGYGIQILALARYIHTHVETIEEVETYLAAKCPYKTGSAVWTPLANYRSFMDETELLKGLEG